MWTRRQGQQFLLGILFAIIMLLVGLAAQVGDWKSEVGAYIAVGLAGVVTLFTLYWAWNMQRSWKRWEPLCVGFISGGMSVEPATRLYEWKAIIPIQNGDDERSVMTKEIYLMVRRGKRAMRVYPKEPRELTLAPGEMKTVIFHFESAGGLELPSGEREADDYEHTATVVIVDSRGNRVERSLGIGVFSTDI